MEPKQEVIQEAWGKTVYPGLDMDMKQWDKGEGWHEHWKETGKVYRNFLNDHNKHLIDLRDDIINLNGWFWPKSLDGIETNNGWIRIESEADLPKKDGKYKVVLKQEEFQYFFEMFWCADEEDRGTVDKWLSRYSHWKPLEEEKAPIY